MMTWTRCFAALLVLGVAGAARAQNDIPWDGPYLGVNLGDASSSSCNTWVLGSANLDSATASEFDQRTCFDGGAFVGGLQAGENFQYRRLVLGVGADLDFGSARNRTQSLHYLGAALPAGTYAYSNTETPRGFAVIGARIGYGGGTWMPYLKAGGVITIGSHSSSLAYTPIGAATPTASFGGGKDYSSTGWAAGAGFELGLNGAWSITGEYLHMNLGKGSDSTTRCSGAVAACAPFVGVTLNNTHEGFNADVFRIGVSYWFNYW